MEWYGVGGVGWSGGVYPGAGREDPRHSFVFHVKHPWTVPRRGVYGRVALVVRCSRILGTRPHSLARGVPTSLQLARLVPDRTSKTRARVRGATTQARIVPTIPTPLASVRPSPLFAMAFLQRNQLPNMALGPPPSCGDTYANSPWHSSPLRKRKTTPEYGLDRNHGPWYTPCMETDQQSTALVTTLMSPPEPDLPVPYEAMEPEVFAYPPLSQDEENFCLAVIEFGGNLGKAYRAAFGDESTFPIAKGKQLLGLPQVALKIKTITDALEEGTLISVGAHLDELARIRDLSLATGEFKVALAAERSRGEAVGIYQKHDAKNKGGGGGNVVIQIAMASQHDKDI